MSAADPHGGARPAARQLAFEFSPQPRYGDDDFLLAPSNAAASALIHAWPAWPDPVLALVGAPGAGKSHLCWRTPTASPTNAACFTCSTSCRNRGRPC
jgi:chromosomal replication initiation ATPase DnaA